MTLGEWLDRWLEEYAAPSVRESTMQSYRLITERYIKPNPGNRYISKITAADVQRLYRKLKKSGRVRRHPALGYHLYDSAIMHVRSMLHLAMENARQAQVVAANPTDGVTVAKPKPQPKRILNGNELERFMEVIMRDEKWKDFDEERGPLRVIRTLHGSKIGEYTAGKTKTGKGMRTITLPPGTAQLLRERKKTAAGEWIFCNSLLPKQPVSPDSACRRMKKILAEAELSSIRFHDLRHPNVKHKTQNKISCDAFCKSQLILFCL